MEFLKVLWENLRQGPVTEAFPFGEAAAPERFRGRVVIDPKLCVGCGTCMHVCVADAININRHPDEGGFEITVWRNACCLCGQCRHYCPTKAVTLVNDWHSAHRAEHKYTFIARAGVRYDVCESCGAWMRFLPHEVLEKIYADHPEVNIQRISRLCPDCRRIEQAVAEERACHIDLIERLAAQNQACPIDFPEQQAQLGLACLLTSDKPGAPQTVAPLAAESKPPAQAVQAGVQQSVQAEEQEVTQAPGQLSAPDNVAAEKQPEAVPQAAQKRSGETDLEVEQNPARSAIQDPVQKSAQGAAPETAPEADSESAKTESDPLQTELPQTSQTDKTKKTSRQRTSAKTGQGTKTSKTTKATKSAKASKSTPKA